MIFICVSPMGKGKTLFASLYALKYSKDYPNNKIYSNYRLKLPNAVYSPYMILPFSELSECLIICDDFANLSNLNSFVTIISSLSRKLDIDIILTCQYYTMIPPIIRVLGKFVEVNYVKEKDILECVLIDQDGMKYLVFVQEAVKKAKNLYNTKEVVKMVNDNVILNEIKKMNLKNEDILDNLYYFFKNKTKIDKYFKILTSNS